MRRCGFAVKIATLDEMGASKKRRKLTNRPPVVAGCRFRSCCGFQFCLVCAAQRSGRVHTVWVHPQHGKKKS